MSNGKGSKGEFESNDGQPTLQPESLRMRLLRVDDPTTGAHYAETEDMLDLPAIDERVMYTMSKLDLRERNLSISTASLEDYKGCIFIGVPQQYLPAGINPQTIIATEAQLNQAILAKPEYLSEKEYADYLPVYKHISNDIKRDRIIPLVMDLNRNQSLDLDFSVDFRNRGDMSGSDGRSEVYRGGVFIGVPEEFIPRGIDHERIITSEEELYVAAIMEQLPPYLNITNSEYEEHYLQQYKNIFRDIQKNKPDPSLVADRLIDLDSRDIDFRNRGDMSGWDRSPESYKGGVFIRVSPEHLPRGVALNTIITTEEQLKKIMKSRPKGYLSADEYAAYRPFYQDILVEIQERDALRNAERLRNLGVSDIDFRNKGDMSALPAREDGYKGCIFIGVPRAHLPQGVNPYTAIAIKEELLVAATVKPQYLTREEYAAYRPLYETLANAIKLEEQQRGAEDGELEGDESKSELRFPSPINPFADELRNFKIIVEKRGIYADEFSVAISPNERKNSSRRRVLSPESSSGTIPPNSPVAAEESKSEFRRKSSGRKEFRVRTASVEMLPRHPEELTAEDFYAGDDGSEVKESDWPNIHSELGGPDFGVPSRPVGPIDSPSYGSFVNRVRAGGSSFVSPYDILRRTGSSGYSDVPNGPDINSPSEGSFASRVRPQEREDSDGQSPRDPNRRINRSSNPDAKREV